MRIQHDRHCDGSCWLGKDDGGPASGGRAEVAVRIVNLSHEKYPKRGMTKRGTKRQNMIVRNKPLYANFALLRANTEGDVRWDSNEPTALRAGFELLAVSARIYISSTEPFWEDTTTHQPSSSKAADSSELPIPTYI